MNQELSASPLSISNYFSEGSLTSTSSSFTTKTKYNTYTNSHGITHLNQKQKE